MTIDHADARIRRAVHDLDALCRDLDTATRPLARRRGRARRLRLAAECAARDTLPAAIRGLRAGLGGEPEGEAR
jgi:hypothetical protein